MNTNESYEEPKVTEENQEQILEEQETETTTEEVQEQVSAEAQINKLLEKVLELSKEVQSLKAELQASEERESLLKAQYQRQSSEYENYRKRTNKEKEELKEFSIAESSKAWLPLFDNLQRASQVEQVASIEEALAGVQMMLKQAEQILEKIGIEEIPALNETFNPELHTAVFHEENSEKGEQEITEVFEKGYRFKDKVLRHSVVKVAN